MIIASCVSKPWRECVKRVCSYYRGGRINSKVQLTYMDCGSFFRLLFDVISGTRALAYLVSHSLTRSQRPKTIPVLHSWYGYKLIHLYAVIRHKFPVVLLCPYICPRTSHRRRSQAAWLNGAQIRQSIIRSSTPGPLENA